MPRFVTKRFFVDITVQRLGKWLRYFGIDAPLAPKSPPEGFNGYLLTKKKIHPHQMAIKGIFYVPYDRIEDQLNWFAKTFPGAIVPNKIGSRCILCNQPLIKIPKKDARNLVPDYVYQTHSIFKKCPHCKRIYWKGSHLGKMGDFLERINFPWGKIP